MRVLKEEVETFYYSVELEPERKFISEIYAYQQLEKYRPAILYQFRGIDGEEKRCVLARQPNDCSCGPTSVLRIVDLSIQDGYDIGDKTLEKLIKENDPRALTHVIKKTKCNKGTYIYNLANYLKELFSDAEIEVYGYHTISSLETLHENYSAKKSFEERIKLEEEVKKQLENKDLYKIKDFLEKKGKKKDAKYLEKIIKLEEKGIEVHFGSDPNLVEHVRSCYTIWMSIGSSDVKHWNSTDPFLNRNKSYIFSCDPNGAIYRYTLNNFKNELKHNGRDNLIIINFK